MCFEILAAYFSTNSTRLEIVEGLDDRTHEPFRITDTMARPPYFENLDDLSCILEMRPE